MEEGEAISNDFLVIHFKYFSILQIKNITIDRLILKAEKVLTT